VNQDEKLTLEEAARRLNNAIYPAADLLEKREGKELGGNGHHNRQRVSLFAQMMLTANWLDWDEAEAYSRHRFGLALADLRELVGSVDM